MSGYIGLNRTGFGPFDDSLSLIEEAGDSYHHTSKWLDEGWNGEKPYIDRINESIEFAANSYSDLIDALTALKAELREICAAIDDPVGDLTLTAVECIKKLKEENEWRPIETAPKDEFVLLAGPSGYTTIETVFTTGRMCSDYHAGRWIDHANDDLTDWGFNPTHWMPLPKPPALDPAIAQGEQK